MVINLLTGSISPQYHIVFDDMLSTVASSISADLEEWIRLVTSINLMILVILYQEDNTELDYDWLTNNERLTIFTKPRERIVGMVKVAESPSVQGPQYSEEDLVVRERVSSRNKSL